MRMFLIACPVMLSGCSLLTAFSDDFYVRFDSNPRGAAVYCDGAYVGSTPVELNYGKQAISPDGFLNQGNCYAIWGTGARVVYPSYPNVAHLLNRGDNGLNRVAHYPSNRRDINKAIDYEYQYESRRLSAQQLRLQQAKARAFKGPILGTPKVTTCQKDRLGNVRCVTQ